MSAKLFVAGATGLTGRAVVAHARDRSIETIAHVRPDSSRLGHWEEHFGTLGAVVDTTPWDEGAMTEALRSHAPTAVLALLGTTRRRARRAAESGGDPAQETYEAVDYGLTALLRRAAEASGVSPRFVYLSSMGAREGSNAYLSVRARIEAELADGTLPWVVARPSFIVGERDESRLGETVGAGALSGALGLLGALGATRLRDRYASINGDDLGRAMLELALRDEVLGKVMQTDALRPLAETSR